MRVRGQTPVSNLLQRCAFLDLSLANITIGQKSLTFAGEFARRGAFSRVAICDDQILLSAKSTVLLALTVRIWSFGLYDSAASIMSFSGFTPVIL
jgi:hypothetical protein